MAQLRFELRSTDYRPSTGDSSVSHTPRTIEYATRTPHWVTAAGLIVMMRPTSYTWWDSVCCVSVVLPLDYRADLV